MEFEEVIGVAGFLPPYSDLSFPLLRFVDPWGDTIFNQQQVKVLAPEWERLESRSKQHGQHDLWHAVKHLIEKSQSEPHLYLRFEGD